MAQRGKGLEERREWFTRVKALSERACRKAEMATFAPANGKKGLPVHAQQQVLS